MTIIQSHAHGDMNNVAKNRSRDKSVTRIATKIKKRWDKLCLHKICDDDIYFLFLGCYWSPKLDLIRSIVSPYLIETLFSVRAQWLKPIAYNVLLMYNIYVIICKHLRSGRIGKVDKKVLTLHNITKTVQWIDKWYPKPFNTSRDIELLTHTFNLYLLTKLRRHYSSMPKGKQYMHWE